MATAKKPDKQQQKTKKPRAKPWEPTATYTMRQPPRPASNSKRGPSAKDQNKSYSRRSRAVDPDYVGPTPETRKKKNSPICGAPRSKNSISGPGVCCQTAGWGTSHLGYGHCKHHGGNSPSHVAKAEKEMASKAVTMFGLPVEIDPHQALMEEIWRTNGHVIWLGDLIANMDDKEKLKQYTDAGVTPSVWVKMYEDERAHLVKVSAEAIKCGVAERQVQLAEEQGRLMAMVLQAFIRDPELKLTPTQLAYAPKILRKHILAAPTALEAVMENNADATNTQQETIIDV